MPASAPESPDYETPPGQTLAVVAESLYLANLLLVPVLAFITLGILFRKSRSNVPPLASAHLQQTFFASLWAGVLLVMVNLFILVLGGYGAPNTWILIILYFTVCHSALILLEMLGLAKALAGKCYRFPILGAPLPEGCKRLL